MTELSRKAIWETKPGRELDRVVGSELFNARIITKESKITEGRILYLLVSITDETFKPMEQGKDMRNAWWRLSEGEAWEAVPRYSTDIAAAWEVVERMRTNHDQYITIYDNPHLNYDVRFSGNKSKEYERLSNLPHAICRAALLATLEEESR